MGWRLLTGGEAGAAHRGPVPAHKGRSQERPGITSAYLLIFYIYFQIIYAQIVLKLYIFPYIIYCFFVHLVRHRSGQEVSTSTSF